jgi:putative modified peptide
MASGPTGITLEIEPEAALELLTRLATDTEFRDSVEADPVAALGEYGISVDPSAVPAKVRLPPRRFIKKTIRLIEEEELQFGAAYAVLWNVLGGFAMPIVARDAAR